MALQIEKYKVKKGNNLGDPNFWNLIFEDIDLRIANTENYGPQLEQSIEDMESVALARLNDTFTPLINEATERLNSLGASFSAESLTELTIGLGTKNLVLTPTSNENYVWTDYVMVRSFANSENNMLGQVTSYDRETALLIIDVVAIEGSGTHSDWLIRVGAPPDATHSGRTDNPHETTAAQVGAYTIAQTEQAIDDAIGALPPISNALLKVNNFSDVPDKSVARTNLGLGNLAIENLVGIGMIASNVRATQQQAEDGTDNTTLMTPLRTLQSHVKARAESIADASGQTFDAKSGGTKIARLVATANRLLIAPTNPVDGQCVIIEHYASGAARTLSLTVGSVGAFRYGTDITGLSATASGKTDKIGVMYNAGAQRWDVVAVAKGF